jgi:hypothetical protein
MMACHHFYSCHYFLSCHHPRYHDLGKKSSSGSGVEVAGVGAFEVLDVVLESGGNGNALHCRKLFLGK